MPSQQSLLRGPQTAVEQAGLSNAFQQELMMASAEAGPGMQTQNAGRGQFAAYTTGRPSSRSGVTTNLLSQSGAWDSQDFLTHHSDRSQSWAANNIRNSSNQDLQAYDFTFERLNERGEPVMGSAQGLPLIVPADAKVIDVQATPAGSGGYGCFVVLEYVESGLRVSVHHLKSVETGVKKGGDLSGGSVFGYQGGSGEVPQQYATHVDIVGTVEAVEQFVRTNQSGDFTTQIRSNNESV